MNSQYFPGDSLKGNLIGNCQVQGECQYHVILTILSNKNLHHHTSVIVSALESYWRMFRNLKSWGWHGFTSFGGFMEKSLSLLCWAWRTHSLPLLHDHFSIFINESCSDAITHLCPFNKGMPSLKPLCLRDLCFFFLPETSTLYLISFLPLCWVYCSHFLHLRYSEMSGALHP